MKTFEAYASGIRQYLVTLNKLIGRAQSRYLEIGRALTSGGVSISIISAL
jgi:hypothetical protein